MENSIDYQIESATPQEENNNIEEDFNQMRLREREERTKRFYSSEDTRKVQSDSTSIISDSSDGLSESFTDSDNHSMKISRVNPKRSKTLIFDAEYPRMIRNNQRSKSQMFKKKYIENEVVNEETVEDEYDIENSYKRKPLRFSNVSFNDDLPSKFTKNMLLLDSLNNTNISQTPNRFSKSNNNTSKILTTNMDPVVEDREEERESKLDLLFKNKQTLSINSPRIKYITDIKEDTTITQPNYYSTSLFHLPRDYSLTVETDEIIAEDNNENIVDPDMKMKKRDSLHKILLENIIDKEENYSLHEINVNISNNFETFETINEENIEEDDKDVIQHKNSSNFLLPITEEFENDNLLFTYVTRLPVINDEDEDLIKESADEEKDDNNDNNQNLY